MLKNTVTIINKLGLHARASMKLVNLAGRFGSDIILCYNNRKVNAKDIMDIMVLGASLGAEIQLEVTGDDEAAAMEAVVALFNDRFGEDE